MESDSIKEKRLRLAEAIRNGESIEGLTEVQIIPSADKGEWSREAFVPRCIYDDYYYAEDNFGNPYTVFFLNRCSNHTEYYKNKVGIPVPPEKPYPSITITIGDEYQTQSTLIQILKHSVMSLDISEVLHKFTNFNKQEDATMDNNVNNDAVAARRRALAEALRTGEPVIVTASGEVETKEDAMDMGMAGIQVPDGKLA